MPLGRYEWTTADLRMYPHACSRSAAVNGSCFAICSVVGQCLPTVSAGLDASVLGHLRKVSLTSLLLQVNGGSQSFNTVNTLRVLGRWMRMFVVPNQSSVPKAWTEFDEAGRMLPSGLRDRVVDVAEELYKFTLLLRGETAFLVDRFSERQEKREKGRLLTQAEKEAEKAAKDSAVKLAERFAETALTNGNAASPKEL